MLFQDIEEGKERRRARTELLKIRQDEPKRKPTLFEIVARLEERKKSVQQMHEQQQIKDAPSENSSTSGEIK
uniref:BHLH domain-containing protein n=1 Tax=Panagrellus redivivus TaxID=6233 RepID=A0A7E4ULW1_PANRE